MNCEEERIKFCQTNIVTSQSVMAASSSAVSVLTPNGRRQTVKVSPNTPLLQVRTHLHTRECNREGCVCVFILARNLLRCLRFESAELVSCLPSDRTAVSGNKDAESFDLLFILGTISA